MPDGSVPRKWGRRDRKHLEVLLPESLTRSLTDEHRRKQDEKLQPIINKAWAGFLPEYRASEEVRLLHQSLWDTARAEWDTLNRGRANDPDAKPHIPSMWGEYTRCVMTFLTAKHTSYLPIDVWPNTPQPWPLTDAQRGLYEDFMDHARERIDLSTPGKLRRNKHYTLLLTSLLVWPDEIRDASEIVVCYPWPFLLRLDEDGDPYLERQWDITTLLQSAADKVERALFDGEKQAPPPARRAR